MNRIIRILSVFLLLTYVLSAQSFDTLQVKKLHPGCIYYQLADGSMPLVLNLVEVDLTKPSIGISMGIAHDSLNLGGERTSDLVSRKINYGMNILAAVNADFFGDNPSQAQNILIIDGELIKAVNLGRSLIAFDYDKKPYIGKFRFNGKLVLDADTVEVDGVNSQDSALSINVLTKYWRTSVPSYNSRVNYLFKFDDRLEANLWDNLDFVKVLSDTNYNLSTGEIVIQAAASYNKFFTNENVVLEFLPAIESPAKGIKTMTGGLPGLIKSGQIPDSFYGHEGLKSKGFLKQHPRTAIGYNKAGNKLFLAAVDGRQEGYSMGITLKGLAEFMLSVGCYEALNFDGGGSTTMTIKDKLANSPSDITGERAVYNSFLILSK